MTAVPISARCPATSSRPSASGDAQSRAHARRDGQARRELPWRTARCSTSRTLPSVTVTSICRGNVRGHAERDRHDPSSLRDRMEIIERPGYTEDEKGGLAKRYLVKRQSSRHWPPKRARSPTKPSAPSSRITRAKRACDGARSRHQPRRHARGGGQDRAHEDRGQGFARHPGARRFESEIALRTSVPGVATGAAYTPIGGESSSSKHPHARQRQAHTHRPDSATS